MKLECSRQIFERYSNIKFHENRLTIGQTDERMFGRTDGQTEGRSYRETDMMKPMVPIRNFANAPKNTSLGPFSV